MATGYTSILKLALPVTGELAGTWGTVVNDNITQMVEQAVAGLATINTWTTNSHTLTVANGTSSESRCAMLVAANGAGLSASGEIICPAASKLYVLKNDTSYQITLKTASGTGVAVPTGQTAFLFCDGTNVLPCITTIVDGTVSGNLTVNGNTTLGNATTDTITATGQFNTDLLPSTDNARDLGSVANSWRTLYCQTSVLGGNLSLAGNTLSSTDTNGDINIVPNGTGKVVLPNLRLSGSSSGYVGLQAAAAAGSTTYTLPSADGTNGQVLSTNGSGVLSWATGGGVTTFSAGTTGLTPSTATTGAITLAGTLAIANGGTGQTTATAAINALLPSQTGNSGRYLTTNGTNTSWATVSAGTPGGSTTQVQYNNAGAFGGSANFTWDNSTSTLTVNGIAIGRGGGGSSTSTAVGASALGTGSTTGVANTAFGASALAGLTSGSSNIGMGVSAGSALTHGGNNVLIGNYAGDAVVSGYYNIAIGGDALGSASTGASYNIAIGQDALKTATNPGGSVAIGYQAADSVTSGSEIVAIGQSALAALVGNGSSVAVGTFAGQAATGDANTLIGNRAGINLTTGANNVGVGNSVFSTSTVTGNFNVAIGETAASTLTSGSNNIILGYNATSSSATVSNEITLGNSSIATLRCQVTTITALSDARDKKDVQDIPLGVSFIQRLHPVSFVWNTRDGGKVDVPEFGFIAQELQQAQRDHGVTLPGLVHDINPERLEAAPGTLIPVLVKAVQELQAQIDDLKRQLAARG